MLSTTIALAALVATAAAAPVDLAPRQDYPPYYTLQYQTGTLSPGHSATFGPGMYNYSEILPGALPQL